MSIFVGLVSVVATQAYASTAEPSAERDLGISRFPDHASADVFGDGREVVLWALDDKLVLWTAVDTEAPVVLPTGSTAKGFSPVVVVDVDGDGHDDALCEGASGWATFRGQPTGLVASGWPEPTLGANVVGLGDINGDGYGDVMVDDRIWLGSPAGLTEGPELPAEASARRADRAFRLGDIDGDGFHEVGLAGSVDGSASADEAALVVWAGGPAGLRATPLWSYASPGRDCALDAALADVDGDLTDELVVACAHVPSRNNVDFVVLSELGSSQPVVLSSNSDAWPEWGLDYEYGGYTEFWGLDALDIDTDGIDEIVVAYGGTVHLATWSTSDGLRVEAEEHYAWGVSGAKRAHSMSTADLDADGRRDLVALFDDEAMHVPDNGRTTAAMWLGPTALGSVGATDSGTDTGDGVDTGSAGVDTGTPAPQSGDTDSTTAATSPAPAASQGDKAAGCGCRTGGSAGFVPWLGLLALGLRRRATPGSLPMP